MGGTLESEPETSPGRCRQSGPRQWEGGQWWVQVISNLKIPADAPCKDKNLATCRIDVIRVCRYPAQPRRSLGPCKTPAGVGDNGCELCVAQEHKP